MVSSLDYFAPHISILLGEPLPGHTTSQNEHIGLSKDCVWCGNWLLTGLFFSTRATFHAKPWVLIYLMARSEWSMTRIHLELDQVGTCHWDHQDWYLGHQMKPWTNRFIVLYSKFTSCLCIYEYENLDNTKCKYIDTK